MAMSNREIKVFILYFLLVISFIDCNKYKKYNEKEISNIRNNTITITKSMIGKDEYYCIYDKMNDSINSFIDNKLGNYTYWSSVINFQIDSIICINKGKNKIVTSILLPYVGKDGVSDEIQFFYGVKIKEQWYFFTGATMVLPREYYQKDIHTPLSFEKLKKIAADHIYRGYLIKDEKGNWQINDKFFEGMENKNQTGAGYGSCFSCQTFEEYVIYLVNLNWQKK